MEQVTRSRFYATASRRVRETIRMDVPAFIRASGYDSVTVEGDSYTVSRHIGFATFELTLERVESDAVLAFEGTEGLFDRMWTEYRLEPAEDGCELIAHTEFSLGGVLGPIVDATMINRQRQREFELQFEYVDTNLGLPNESPESPSE